MILIYITCPNKKEANKIGLTLVKKRLAGCVNTFPIESMYWWPASAKASAGKNNKIAEDKEVVLIAKTLEKNFQKIEKLVKKLHSYEIPCIFSIPVEKVSKNYLNWLKKEIL